MLDLKYPNVSRYDRQSMEYRESKSVIKVRVNTKTQSLETFSLLIYQEYHCFKLITIFGYKFVNVKVNGFQGVFPNV